MNTPMPVVVTSRETATIVGSNEIRVFHEIVIVHGREPVLVVRGLRSGKPADCVSGGLDEFSDSLSDSHPVSQFGTIHREMHTGNSLMAPSR